MALPRVYRVIQDQVGNIVPQVLCSVYNQGTGVLAPLWQDDAGTVPLSNPLTSDATYGSVKFYIAPGHFDMSFTKPGYTFEPVYDFQVPDDNVTLGTMATQNAASVAITGGTLEGLTGVVLNGTGIENGRLVVRDAPAGSTSALRTQTTAGAGRYQLYCEGTASHYLNGIVGIQAPNAAPPDLVRIMHRKANQHALSIQPSDNDTGSGIAVLLQNVAGTPVGSITTTGTATSFNTSSDARLKEAWQPLTGALDVVRRLRPITHLWRADGSRGYGFLAHEVQDTIPDGGIVTGERDAVDAEGTIIPQQMDPGKLIPWLTAALQEALAALDTLTARVQALEAARA